MLSQPGADARVAVLDHRFWRDQMAGDPGVIGRTVTINGHPFTIAGVVPDGFHGAGPERPPLWVPLVGVAAADRRAGRRSPIRRARIWP